MAQAQIVTSNEEAFDDFSLRFLAGNCKTKTSQRHLHMIAQRFSHNVTFENLYDKGVQVPQDGSGGYYYACIYKNLLRDFRKFFNHHFNRFKMENNFEFKGKDKCIKEKFLPF
jgi:hypothetical protein